MNIGASQMIQVILFIVFPSYGMEITTSGKKAFREWGLRIGKWQLAAAINGLRLFPAIPSDFPKPSRKICYCKDPKLSFRQRIDFYIHSVTMGI